MKLNKVSFFLFITLGFVLSCQIGQTSQTEVNPPPMRDESKENQPAELKVFALEEDILIYEQAIEAFENSAFDNTSIGDLMTSIATHFIQTPYAAFTLEIPEEEQLVVNLRGMDCTTFVEYVLAMSLSIKSQDMRFASFIQNLAFIRYRDGIIKGYPSRLHYFSEWLYNNAQKGVITMLGDSIGTKAYRPTLSFMSKNPSYYPQLKNQAVIDSIRAIEKRVSSIEMNYIPKKDISSLENIILNGDIIAFTTDMEGLDVSHTGIALKKNGRLFLIHASTRSNQVEISPVPLSQYLKPMNRVTGILVGRIQNN